MTQPRIKIWMGWLLITTALCVDLAEMGITWLGLVVIGGIASTVLSFVVGFMFSVWLAILGVNTFTGKGDLQKLSVRGGAFFGEILPMLDAIPIFSFLWTIGMMITVGMSRMEDKGEEPTIWGAFANIISFTSFNPATMVVNAARKRISRTFRKPQKPLEPLDADGTI